jgi:sporulation protein YlmC with PRC-barrel domain
MKTKRLELAAMSTAIALCAQLSLAQENDQKQTQQTGRSKDRSAQASDSLANGLHLSKLIGAQVKSNTGENLGKLEDVVIDPQTGKAAFAIVGTGGVLRLGEKRMPVPWQAVTIDSQKRLTLKVDKEKLQSAPTTAKSDDSELEDPDFVVVLYKFYEIPAGAPGETPGGTEQGTSKQGTSKSESDPGGSKP